MTKKTPTNKELAKTLIKYIDEVRELRRNQIMYFKEKRTPMGRTYLLASIEHEITVDIMTHQLTEYFQKHTELL